MDLRKQFARYVSQNIFGMVGVSFYIIVDTFFIALAAGADGITVLNLALPIYGVMFAIGALIGVGAATRFAIAKARGDKDQDFFFSNAVMWDVLFAIPFSIVGFLAPDAILRLMGGDAGIVALGKNYVQIFMCFAPAFMLNNTFSSFVRNDGEPTRAMIATLSGSIANVVFDYIFMFVMGMGLAGAAVATVTSPMLAILINSLHFRSAKNTMRFVWQWPSVKRLVLSCQLGVAALIGELSSAVTTMVFNFLILGLVGNIGVAAYGIIANLALVVVAIFNGIAQGAQPLMSEAYGQNDRAQLRSYLRMGLVTAGAFSLAVIGLAFLCTDGLIAVFNSEGQALLHDYAFVGLRLYFLGYIFAGINVVLTGYFGAVARPVEAFVGSIMRGVVAIVLCAVVMAHFFGMNGVWLSFVAAEGITFVLCLIMLRKKRNK